jgi:hypothetical protein
VVMQRNCHEFIAYENLVGSRRTADRGRQSGPVASQAPIEQAVPLVRRALKVLIDREVTPQLGLLKSTLLQLDSTFSERTYGVGSFRDFAQKLAAAGHVVLRESGRNVLVELAEGNGSEEPRVAQPQAPHPPAHRRSEDSQPDAPSDGGRTEARTADGIREVRRLFQAAQNPPRWPMYIRQAKQFLRNVDGSFDERKFGFASLVDLMRACQRDGLFRIERDRQGVMRLFPGNIMQAANGDAESRGNVAEPAAAAPMTDWPGAESSADSDVVDGDVVQEMNAPSPVLDVETAGSAAEAPAEEPRGPKARGGRRPKAHPAAPKEPKAPRARKASSSKPRAPRPPRQKEPVAS